MIKPEDDVIMPVILPRARANGALLVLKLRTGSAPSDAANLHPASEYRIANPICWAPSKMLLESAQAALAISMDFDFGRSVHVHL